MELNPIFFRIFNVFRYIKICQSPLFISCLNLWEFNFKYTFLNKYINATIYTMSAKEFYNSGEQGEYNGPQQIDNNAPINQQQQEQGGYGGKLSFINSRYLTKSIH